MPFLKRTEAKCPHCGTRGMFVDDPQRMEPYRLGDTDVIPVAPRGACSACGTCLYWNGTALDDDPLG